MFPLLGGAIRSVTAPTTSDIPVILVAVAECDVLAASLVFAATIRVGIISRRACCRRCGCCVPWFAEAGERVRVATVFFFRRHPSFLPSSTNGTLESSAVQRSFLPRSAVEKSDVSEVVPTNLANPQRSCRPGPALQSLSNIQRRLNSVRQFSHT